MARHTRILSLSYLKYGNPYAKSQIYITRRSVFQKRQQKNSRYAMCANSRLICVVQNRKFRMSELLRLVRIHTEESRQMDDQSSNLTSKHRWPALRSSWATCTGTLLIVLVSFCFAVIYNLHHQFSIRLHTCKLVPAICHDQIICTTAVFLKRIALYLQLQRITVLVLSYKTRI